MCLVDVHLRPNNCVQNQLILILVFTISASMLGILKKAKFYFSFTFFISSLVAYALYASRLQMTRSRVVINLL